MGNYNAISAQNEGSISIESRNKMNEYATVIGDSCLMLALAKLPKESASVVDLLRHSKSCQQMQVFGLSHSTFGKNFKLTSYEQIEFLYKANTRILGYKNLGTLKASW